MSAKKVVLMNHTDMLGHHFGCARVMRLIEAGLEGRGCRISGRIDGKLDWRQDRVSLSMLADCDAIVINGEGTLHHGRKKAGWLMDVARHAVTRDKELALVNALYQENPTDWAPLAARFAHLYARDSRSGAALSRHAGRPVTWFGDLSTSAGALADTVGRQGIIVGDSVSAAATALLAELAQDMAFHQKVRLVPLTVSLREENPYRPWLIRRFRRQVVALRQKRIQRRYPLLSYLGSEAEYLDLLRSSQLSVTGRFHGVCLNLVTCTPFVCVSSNSWKIEALFEDAGLDPRRLLPRESLTVETILGNDWRFSTTETAKIARFLERSVAGATAMFDAIAGA